MVTTTTTRMARIEARNWIGVDMREVCTRDSRTFVAVACNRCSVVER